MFTRSNAIVRHESRRPARLAVAVLSAAACLAVAAPAEAGTVPAAAAMAADQADAPIIHVSGGRKAAWIIGGIAALGAGAAIAAQNRRVDPGYADPGYGYAPAPVYAPPPPVYAPAPVYADPYAEDEAWDYAPPPPPPVYPRRGYYAYGGYDREPTVSVDYYGRRTRLLPEGK